MENRPHPAEELWRRTLSQIATIYGRIVFLSSLRNVNTGRYEHHGLSIMFGEEATDRTLSQSHEQAFLEWLSLRLEQQKADLDLYLSSLPADRKTLAENWLRLAPFQTLPPAWASSAQRELFESNLKVLLDLLTNEYGSLPER